MLANHETIQLQVACMIASFKCVHGLANQITSVKHKPIYGNVHVT